MNRALSATLRPRVQQLAASRDDSAPEGSRRTAILAGFYRRGPAAMVRADQSGNYTMRRRPLAKPAVCLLAILAVGSASQPVSAQNGPPHAWLFGSWTGGLFPASSSLTAQACLATPVVIFTRDMVLRATLTDINYTQRVIETARSTGTETDFHFAPAAAPPPTSALLGATMASPPAAGFGCEDPNVLHVQRRSENEISFPNCAEFPNPLIRCPSR